MKDLENNDLQSNIIEQTEPGIVQLHRKLDELILLLENSNLDNAAIQDLHLKFNAALRAVSESTDLQPYSRSYARSKTSENLDGELEQLSSISQSDERKPDKIFIPRLAGVIIRTVISLLLILLGFGMIIMPAPPYFEMYTLFYLSPNDGVTIMDIISLIVAFTGIYLMINTVTYFRNAATRR